MTRTPNQLQRLTELHHALSGSFRKHNITLQAVNSGSSVVGTGTEQALVFAYLRQPNEAQTVQRQIGLRGSALALDRHPLIELRLTERHLTLEFVLPVAAWWDQRNLAGKLSLPRYRDEFATLLMSLDPDMAVGHWHGLLLDAQHLAIRQLATPRAMGAWLETFADGRDPVRIGCWLPADAIKRDVLPDLFPAARSLYAVYQFAAWTGRNDFQTFFHQQHSRR